MKRSWVLGGGLLFFVLLVGVALYVRSSGMERGLFRRDAGPRTTSPAAAPDSSPKGGLVPKGSGSGVPAPLSPLRQSAEAQGKALVAVLKLLKSKGGAAALQYIREAVLRPPSSLDDRLNQAFLARLIAYVAATDSSSIPAALGLSRDILQSSVASPWARLQAAAGLCGRSSTPAIPMTMPGRPDSYFFHVRPPGATQEGPFQASLLVAARQDPVIGGSLAAILALEQEAIVRQELVHAVGALGAVGSADVLRGSALADPETGVRGAALEALERSSSADLADIAQRMVRTDADPQNQGDALELLGRTSATNPATIQFLTECLASQEPRAALPALARSTFAALESAPSKELQDGLTRLLLHNASDADLAEAFAREAVDRELPHFLPLLRTLEASLPADSPSRESLSRAAAQLEEAPNYAALAKRIKSLETTSRTLMEESAQSSTSEGRRSEIEKEMSALLGELWEAERKLGR